MDGFDGFDSLINDVVHGRTKGTAIKIKTFANNFANISNIGVVEIRVGNDSVTSFGASGSENTELSRAPPVAMAPTSPSPSPPPANRALNTRKRTRVKSRSPSRTKKSESPLKRPKVLTPSDNGGGVVETKPSELIAKGLDIGNPELKSHSVKKEKKVNPFSKSFLFLPKSIHIDALEKQEVEFEIPELRDVESEVEVKVCLSFGYERSLNMETKKKLVSCCQIDVVPTQKVRNGKVGATFSNIKSPGSLKLDVGMKIGVCRYHYELAKVEDSSRSSPTVETSTETVDEKTPQITLQTKPCGDATMVSVEELKEAFERSDHAVFKDPETSHAFVEGINIPKEEDPREKLYVAEATLEAVNCQDKVTTTVDTSEEIPKISDATSESTAEAVAQTTHLEKPNVLDIFSFGKMEEPSSFHEPEEEWKNHQQMSEEWMENNPDGSLDVKVKKDIKDSDDIKYAQQKLEKIRSEMTALDYLDSGICRFADMYFDWCLAEGREIKSDEGDELLQQVGMICQSDVTIEELLDVLKTNWSEDENNWKAIFGQKFSLVHSDSVITEFDTILQVLILAYRRELHVEADTDNSSEKSVPEDIFEDKKEEKKRSMEEELAKLRAENEQLRAHTYKVAENLERLEAMDVVDPRSRRLKDAASFFQENSGNLDNNDLLCFNEQEKQELTIVGAEGMVEDFLPDKNIYQVTSLYEQDMLILFTSRSADMFLGKTIQYDASQVSRGAARLLFKKFHKDTYRVTKVYSALLDDLDDENEFLLKLTDVQAVSGPASLTKTQQNLLLESKLSIDTKKEPGQKSASECVHYPAASFCKQLRNCAGNCGSHHTFNQLQHNVLFEDVGSFCFKFPKYLCSNKSCNYPHISWVALCRAVWEGLENRRHQCVQTGRCGLEAKKGSTGCLLLREADLSSEGLCHRLSCRVPDCRLSHLVPRHLQLPKHCRAFLTESCVVEDGCGLPHIQYDDINEIFIRKRSALAIFCDECVTINIKTDDQRVDLPLTKQELKPEVRFDSSSLRSKSEDEVIRSKHDSWRSTEPDARAAYPHYPESQIKPSIFSRLGFSVEEGAEKTNNRPRDIDVRENLRTLERELGDLLQHSGRLPFLQISQAFNRRYKRQLVLNDYGFQKGELLNLLLFIVDKADCSLEISGDGKDSMLQMKHAKCEKFSRTTFLENSRKMLQVHGTLSRSVFWKTYRDIFGEQHQLENYGFHREQDIIYAGQGTFYCQNGNIRLIKYSEKEAALYRKLAIEAERNMSCNEGSDNFRSRSRSKDWKEKKEEKRSSSREWTERKELKRSWSKEKYVKKKVKKSKSPTDLEKNGMKRSVSPCDFEKSGVKRSRSPNDFEKNTVKRSRSPKDNHREKHAVSKNNTVGEEQSIEDKRPRKSSRSSRSSKHGSEKDAEQRTDKHKKKTSDKEKKPKKHVRKHKEKKCKKYKEENVAVETDILEDVVGTPDNTSPKEFEEFEKEQKKTI